MSGASGSERGETFHHFLQRNLPLYLYNCILVAGFDKPQVFTSLMEPAAVNKMEEYVRNCVVPALTTREERQRYVGLFADKPQLFQISPGHRIQLMMLVRDCRSNKLFLSSAAETGTPISPVASSAFAGENYNRGLNENESNALSKPNAIISPSTSAYSNYTGLKRKLGDTGAATVVSIPRVSQGLYLNPIPSPQTQSHQSPQQQSSSHDQPAQQSQHPSIRGAGGSLSDDASSCTGVSVDSDLPVRTAFQPGNNTTHYASPISVEEHERRILRLLDRWLRAQLDPVIQNLQRNIDYHLIVARQAENDVVTAKIVCLRCKKSVALVGRGDTWVLSNYHRHLRSCLNNERHMSVMAASALGRENLMQSANHMQNDNGPFDMSTGRDDSFVQTGSSEPSHRVSLSNASPLIISQVDVSTGRICNNMHKYDQYPMKTESMASDFSLVDDSESENGVSSAATPRDHDGPEESIGN